MFTMKVYPNVHVICLPAILCQGHNPLSTYDWKTKKFIATIILWTYVNRTKMDTPLNQHSRSSRDGLRKQPTFCDATKVVSPRNDVWQLNDCSNKLSIYGKRSKSQENARVSKGKTRKGQTPLNGELARRLSALYSNPEFNWNERHSMNSIWTAWKDVHTSIRTVLSHDNFHWLYNLHRHWWGHEGCICSTMGFSTDMVYYVLVQNSYFIICWWKERSWTI